MGQEDPSTRFKLLSHRLILFSPEKKENDYKMVGGEEETNATAIFLLLASLRLVSVS